MRDEAVTITTAKFHRLKRQDRRVLSAEDFSDEEIEAIRKAEVPAEYAFLNDELKNWKA